MHIRKERRVYNLDETGFTPGRDLAGCRQRRVASAKDNRPIVPKLAFRYKNRVSIIVSIFAGGTAIHPVAIFKGFWEPWLSDGSGSAVKVSMAVPPDWSAYWRRDIASVDTSNFNAYIFDFIRRARAKVESNQ